MRHFEDVSISISHGQEYFVNNGHQTNCEQINNKSESKVQNPRNYTLCKKNTDLMALGAIRDGKNCILIKQ